MDPHLSMKLDSVVIWMNVDPCCWPIGPLFHPFHQAYVLHLLQENVITLLVVVCSVIGLLDKLLQENVSILFQIICIMLFNVTMEKELTGGIYI